MANKHPRGAKSQAIRDYLKANRKAKASEVVTALAAKGITVSAPQVYNLKARQRMSRRRHKAEANGQSIELSITNLVAAKKLVDQTGGFDQARAALDALAKLA